MENKMGKKGGVIKILIILILLVFLVILIMLAIYIYVQVFNGDSKCPRDPNDSYYPSLNDSQTVTNETIITTVLYMLGVDKLRNPPMSNDTPKLEIILTEDQFNSEVISHKIFTHSGLIDNEDVVLFINPQLFDDILNSSSVRDTVIKGVKDGLILVKPVKGYATLFAKGYYDLYKRFDSGKGGTTTGITNRLSNITDYEKEGFVKLEFLNETVL